jgi:hypothetical protein
LPNLSEEWVVLLSLVLRLTQAHEHLVSKFDALTSDLEKYAIWMTGHRG